MVNWLVFCSFIFSIALTLIGLVMDLTYQIQYVPEIQARQQSLQLQMDHYLKEKSFYSDHFLFADQPRKGLDFQKFFEPMASQTAVVRPPQLKRVLEARENWLEKKYLTPLTPRTADLFEQISFYQYWNLPSDFEDQKVFDPVQLIVAAQVYLTHTFYHQPELLQSALTNTRHLAKLLLSTEQLNYKRAGLSIIEKEKDLLEFVQSRQLKLALEWTTVEPEALTGFRHFLSKTESYLSFLAPPSVLESVFLSDRAPAGFCAVFTKKRPVLRWTHQFLSQQFPLEPNFQPNIEVMDRIAMEFQKNCHSQTEGSSSIKPLASKIPYYRRLLAMRFILKKNNNQETL